MNKKYSCYGCKYLYKNGTGYSDWTWESTEITCAKGLNDNLPIEEPSNYDDDMTGRLRWLARLACECDEYSQGSMVTVSPDGNVLDGSQDDKQMRAILGDNYKDWKDGKINY